MQWQRHRKVIICDFFRILNTDYQVPITPKQTDGQTLNGQILAYLKHKGQVEEKDKSTCSLKAGHKTKQKCTM